MLISVCGREILTEVFKSFEEAHAQMMDEFCRYGRIEPSDCTETESECDSEFGYCEWNAYVNDGINHEDYDWLIVKI